jgi:hypothetical protein
MDNTARQIIKNPTGAAKKPALLVAFVATAFVLAGCATESESHQVAASIPALAPGDGRIYFYRTIPVPTQVFPTIILNGQVVGAVKPRAFFYVDRPPGDYHVETSDAKPPGHWNFSLAKGQIQYVRIDIPGMGALPFCRGLAILIILLPLEALGGTFYNGPPLDVHPTFVNNITGEKEIHKCSYASPN